MKKLLHLLFAALLLSPAAAADTIPVRSFRYSGPIRISKPYLLDSVNIQGDTFKVSSVFEPSMALGALRPDAQKVETVPACGYDALHVLGFSLQNMLYAKGSLQIAGLSDYQFYIDGKSAKAGALTLEPGTHDCVIACYVPEKGLDSLKVTLTSDKDGRFSLREDGRKIYSLDLNTDGPRCACATVSAGGKYICLGRKMTAAGGAKETWYDVIRAKDGAVISTSKDYSYWMPTGDLRYFTRAGVSGRDIYTTDPSTGQETLLFRGLPEGHWYVAPAGDYLVYTMTQKGPKEGEVHEILAPNDRHPGWRDRSWLAKLDLKTGVMQPLTFGWHSSWLCDISRDGKQILFMTSRERLTKRPTTLFSLYVMDAQTLETRCLVSDDGFLSKATFSPDGTQVLVTASPEGLGGAGLTLPEGVIPSMFDYDLFTVSVADGSVRALTRDFRPNIIQARWCPADGKIYALVEDKDTKVIYRIDPKTLKTENIGCKEECVYDFDFSDTGTLVYYGQSLMNGDRAYSVNLKSLSHRLLRDFGEERLGDVEMGQGDAYEFTSRLGDTINGFYVLPPDFDPAKKYPLLVHYYGGCSPTTRYCTGSYSPQVYAAQGYVFYVVNPSGATGFGQEFASRHVNTAGDTVSDDIIEATKRFCQDHPFIDTARVGCFSASYGGFMTQLLLAKTDIYATGISHAGISDHASYWGEGYWGFSYSETCMANSYPWTRKDLFVDHSPLYMADRIHTPLLFLHGSADTNVPIGESIQMYTALRLLGAETAFVVVDGENHGVYDYTKRRQWLRTMFAWFAKYLQNDSTWWDALYPDKNL